MFFSLFLFMNDLLQHYDRLASARDAYRDKNTYYYSLLFKEYQYLIPKNKKVLEVGCSTGDLLDAVKPSVGVGIDISPRMISIAQEKYPFALGSKNLVERMKLRRASENERLLEGIGDVNPTGCSEAETLDA